MQEIERKFLVKNDAYKAQAASHKRITQGYLNAHPERTVRFKRFVRIYSHVKGSVKGKF